MIIFLIFLFPFNLFSIDRSDIQKILDRDLENERFTEGILKKSASPYYIDLNGDKKSENIVVSFINGHYEFAILNGAELLSKQQIRSKGGQSRIDRYFIQNIGKGYSTILVFITEGVSSTLDSLIKKRIDLITFERNDLTKLYYYEGPLVSFKKESWDGQKTEMKSQVFFNKTHKYKTKVLMIKEETFSTTLRWSIDQKTWY